MTIIQMRNMALTIMGTMGGEKWSNSRYNFQVDLIYFTDKLDLEQRQREKSRMKGEKKGDPRFFSLNNWKDGVSIN